MFCVELAKPEGPVQWLWNQKAVVAGGRVAVTAEGTCHTLTISRCSLEDVGEVAFVAGDCRTSTQFCVSGKGRESPCRTEGAPPFMLGRVICFTQSANSNVNLIQKHSHRHTQN